MHLPSFIYTMVTRGKLPFLGNEEMFSSADCHALLNECEEASPTTCNKETGERRRLQKWSRGHFFIVRGSGIIDKWNPIFGYGVCLFFSYVFYSCTFIVNLASSQMNQLSLFVTFFFCIVVLSTALYPKAKNANVRRPERYVYQSPRVQCYVLVELFAKKMFSGKHS